MIDLKQKRDLLTTVVVKGGILVLNFLLVVLTARLWGSEGRGFVALFTADVAFVSMFTNVFTSSSVAYLFAKVGTSRLATQAVLWSFIVSAVAAMIAFVVRSFSFAVPLFMVSVMTGLFAFQSSIFLATQGISRLNILTLLQPLLVWVGVLMGYFLFPQIGYFLYFFAQIIALSVVLVVAWRWTRPLTGRLSFDWDAATVRQTFSFGWRVELSALLQFLNYRLTYYALELVVGVGAVGLFSIGVTVSEAIWVFSRSISMVQYSNVLKNGDTAECRRNVEQVARYALYASLLCVAVIAILPESFFLMIFGGDYVGVKTVMMLLAPGVLLIAFSNVYGHYFSAIGELRILIGKSAAGLLATLVLAYLLIPRHAVWGAAVVNSASYVVSSLCIVVYYIVRKNKTLKIKRNE